MVLPVIVYRLGEAEQDHFFGQLSDLGKTTETPFRILLSTDDVNEAVKAVQEAHSVSAIVLGIDSFQKDKQKLSLRLGKLAMQVNRDHYVIYVVKTRDELEAVLPFCARCSGVLVCPLEEKAIRQVMKPVLEDYHQLYQQESSQDGKWLNLKSGGKVYRILLNDVCMVQAVDKMVEFHTSKQTISVYSSMDSVEKMLDDNFLRCHRSYFINREQIQYVDFREMTIHLMDGSLVPLARSFKEAMNKTFALGRA